MARQRKAPGVKVSNLTPDNIRLLKAADHQLVGAGEVSLTPTTATFGCVSATAALAAVNGAIRIRKQQGEETRPLHAVRRKLEKLVEAERKAITAGPGGCYHVQGKALGHDRAKCLDCGLVVDVHAGMELVSENKPMRPGQGGTTTASVVYVGDGKPMGQEVSGKGYARQNGRQRPQATALVVVHGDSWLVVQTGDEHPEAGAVLAVCAKLAHAQVIVDALNRLSTVTAQR